MFRCFNSRVTRAAFACLVFACLTLSSSPALAQSATGSIEGVIVDQTGAFCRASPSLRFTSRPAPNAAR